MKKEYSKRTTSSIHNGNTSLGIIKEDSKMNIQTTKTNLPANISATLSALPEMRIPSTILCEKAPNGLDLLVHAERGIELITYVRNGDELVIADYHDEPISSPIAQIFSEDDFFDSDQSKDILTFELSKIEELLENADANVLFYMFELISSFNLSKENILRLFTCLTSDNIHQEDVFRALSRASQEDIESIIEVLESGGDALCLKNIINSYNDVPTSDDDDYDGYFDDDDESIDDDYNDNGED